MKIEYLITLVVVGVIVADLAAHAAGTTSFFKGLDMLFKIGINPTNTSAIKPIANGK